MFPRIREQVPSARFEIVGKNPPNSVLALANEHIVVTGRVDSVSPYLSRATALVVPLRSGSGTRIKILEAFAAGVPVISTAIGCEGLEVEHGRELFIADTAESFADACVHISRDAVLARKLCDAAGALARAKYDWQRTVDTIEKTLIGVQSGA
jgi:glycosyltransferase involved in cell wall biosynthesis